jgi:uncharacterized membrane protein YagU involved in acid resistance
MRPCFAGAVGGTLATVPMTAVMVALHRRLSPAEQFPLPPREITQQVAQRAGLDSHLAERQRTDLSLLAHFGYGAATGALQAVLFPKPRHPLLQGSAYGLAVWAISYLGWIPAAGILRPATEHPRRRRRLMLLAHIVWGGVAACVTPYLTKAR